MLRKFFLTLIGVFLIVLSNAQYHKSNRPKPIFRESISQLSLPENATAIRENIVNNFSCENRIYGYYADIDNECQIFHVCLPLNRGSIRWSFICPAETVFNQETFVCTKVNDSIPCEESEQYYVLNEEFGKEEELEDPENAISPTDIDNELPATPSYPRGSRPRGRPSTRQSKNRRFDFSKNYNNSRLPEITPTTLNFNRNSTNSI